MQDIGNHQYTNQREIIVSFLQNILGGLLKPALTYMSRGRLPQIEGRIRLPGLQGEATIFRDRWGIPHLQAAHRHDLYLVQGYVHAGERLWQMEINRRVATGQLAELFGEQVLDTDRLTRTLGFHRLAKLTWLEAAEQTQADLSAYAAGVNAFMEREKLPIEFSLLRHSPQPWQPEESLAYSSLQSWALCTGWSSELVRAQLAQTLDPTLLAELEPRYPDAHPSTLPKGVEFNQLTLDNMLQAAVGPILGKGSLDGGGRGSNGWVISAARSATGSAILCNDMHLPLSTPGLWYYVHQQCAEQLHVAGVTMPGAPYVLVGHNDHIAWGATLTFTDSEDLYVERLNETGTSYQFAGEWRDLEVIPEQIRIKGKPDHFESVRLTHHGPIISQTLKEWKGRPPALALCSVALQPHQAIEGFARLNVAQGWDDFAGAMAFFKAPTLNLIYADTKDNIGHWFAGLVPIRSGGDGAVPAPGWTGEHEWRGFVPLAEMPHALNPEQGYLITCNHRIIDDHYPYFLGNMWMNGYRAQRLEELLSEQESISLEDCQRFQFDLQCAPGRQIVERLSDLETDDTDVALALQLLRGWNGWLGPESVGGAVYKVFMTRLARVILGNGLDLELHFKVLGTGEHPLLSPANEYLGYWPITLMHMLDDPTSGWLPGQIGREAILNRCLAETISELRVRLGERPAEWQWGRLHGVSFDHVLAAQPPLDRVFSQGPFPIGGDTDTVLQTSIRPDAPFQNNNVSPSYRQIIDLGSLGNSRAMHAPGQSGHLGSMHYGDLVQPWLEGKYFTMTWDWREIGESCRYRQTFEPAEQSLNRT